MGLNLAVLRDMDSFRGRAVISHPTTQQEPGHVSRPLLVLLVLGVALGLSSCAPSASEIMVVVDTTFVVPAELSHVRITYAEPSGRVEGVDVELRGDPEQLPLTMLIFHGSGALGPVDITVEGFDAPPCGPLEDGADPACAARIVERRVQTEFVAGQTMALAIPLLRQCGFDWCDGRPSCSQAGCDGNIGLVPWPASIRTPACPSGFEDCDSAIGCEQSLTNDEHCGGCDSPCVGGEVCRVVDEGDGMERIECREPCPAGQQWCGACVDVQSDNRHCGRCDSPCTVDQGTGQCTNGICVAMCAAGARECVRDGAQLCRTPDDPEFCGASCESCPGIGAPEQVVTCPDGLGCAYQCDSGFADCDGDVSNGCEASVDADVNHCGGCGMACAPGIGCDNGYCEDQIVEIAAGDYHTCIRLQGGEVRCWGDNTHGQVGASASPVPRGVTAVTLGMGRVAQRFPGQYLAAGGAHTCVIDDMQNLWCWGRNDRGQLGKDGDTASPRSTPDLVDNPPGGSGNWVGIAAGELHTCGIERPARVSCFGDNATLQLGREDSSVSMRALPMQVPGMDAPFEWLALGSSHSCVVNDGVVRCWGNNRTGQVLGIDPTPAETNDPREPPIGATVTQIASTDSHTLAVTSGAAVCWGAQSEVQCSWPSPLTQLPPPATAGPYRVRQSRGAVVAAGEGHSCELSRLPGGDEVSGVSCWGDHRFGGPIADFPTEVLAADGSSFADAILIAAGRNHTCAVLEHSSVNENPVVCWGMNDRRQLGVDAPSPQHVPVRPDLATGPMIMP